MLDPRLVALQGLTVPLTPIYVAVQGLIALIQEEARRDELHGGGKKRGAAQPKRWGTKQAGQARGQVGADVSEAEVRAQWEALEARQREQATPPAQAPAQAEQPAPVAQPLAPAPPSQAVKPVARPPLEADDEEALTLILSLL